MSRRAGGPAARAVFPFSPRYSEEQDRLIAEAEAAFGGEDAGTP